jgi:hypothetical protein
LNDVIGSWNTIANAVPSSRRCVRSVPDSTSVPMNSSRSAVTSPGRSTSRAIARAVSDLPEPDSPTTPTASPRPIRKLTPRTGRTGPAGPGKATERSCTSSTGRPADSPGSVAGTPSSATGTASVSALALASADRPEARPPPTAVVSPMPLATASPNRLKASPATTIATPGASAASGWM